MCVAVNKALRVAMNVHVRYRTVAIDSAVNSRRRNEMFLPENKYHRLRLQTYSPREHTLSLRAVRRATIILELRDDNACRRHAVW